MMFEQLFGPSTSQLAEAQRSHVAMTLAIATLLIEKGVITEKEYDAARLRLVAELDQQFAELREKSPHAETEKTLRKFLGGDFAE